MSQQRGTVRFVSLVGGLALLAGSLIGPVSPVSADDFKCPPGAPLAGRPAAEPTNSAAAIDALGDRLTASAGAVGRSAKSLRQELVRDSTLWVDRCGLLNYVDPGVYQAADADAAGSLATGEAAILPADAFTLHSRPGSQRTIFLDFDGYQVPDGNAWRLAGDHAAWNAPPFDLDSTPATFSTAERNVIIEVWQRVADDYAPFDVDVTTVDPGDAALVRANVADQVYGSRALISPDPGIASRCGCGGWAYLDVFDGVGAGAFQPAWVLPQNLANNAKYIAEAASHEVGHNLSLMHDGRTSPPEGYYTGSGGWAPIMGVGYYQPVSQWSKGEYPAANNTEDDLALMAASGVPILADDFGGTPADSKPVVPGQAVEGVITSAADVDWFSFNASGVVSVTATPTAGAPNLDLSVALTDASGTQLASAAPVYQAATWPANAAATVNYTTAGPVSLRVKVDGTGNGVPSSNGATDYGSLGRYKLTVTASGVIANVTPPTMTVGRPVSIPLSASGGKAPYSWAVVAGSLPAGLSVVGAAITGTPTSAGSTTATLQVTDSLNAMASKAVTFQVVAAPVLGLASPQQVTVGAAVSHTVTVTGGVAPLTWQTTGLPPGLTQTGPVISGTPTTAGTYAVNLQVTDANGAVATKQVSYQVAAHLQIANVTPPTMTVGRPVSIPLSASGGKAPYSWAVVAGSLPAGLSVVGAAITGTPTSAGSTTATLQVTDSLNAMASKAVTFQVVAAPVLGLASPQQVTVGAAVSHTVTVTGGVAPLTWQTTGLPPGLTQTGPVISGTPTTAGTYAVNLQVTDANGAVATKQVSYQVAAQLQITSSASLRVTAGSAVSFAMTSAGGRAPITWAIRSGTLPAGLALSGSSISGTPTVAGSKTVTLGATDANGALATQSFTVVVDPKLAVTEKLKLSATVGQTVQAALSSTGGRAPVSWAVTSGAMPPGLSLAGSSITGTFRQPGNYSALITATDANGGKASSLLTAEVAAQLLVPAARADLTLGSPASVMLPGIGGKAPLTWTISGNTVGLTLNGSRLVGTPAVAGSYQVNVSVTDANGAAAAGVLVLVVGPPRQVATEPSTEQPATEQPAVEQPPTPGGGITTYPAPAPTATAAPTSAQPTPTPIPRPTPAPTVLTLPATTELGVVARKKRASIKLTVVAGKAPMKWKRTAGKLPKGMKLSKKGVLSGKPKKAGTYGFTLQVTDAAKVKAKGVFVLRVK
ncbi:MAG: putative Ig domain-containing protein [Candidatus Nanopelagicales bacterium]